MSDNTQVTAGTGDFVRDIDRTGQPGGQSAKTQVVQLDVGGQYRESLVNPFNPVPTQDMTLLATQGSEAPQFVTITGDPNGDFAGVNILEKLVDDSGDLKMAVRVVNPPGKFDAQGAQIASDAPSPIYLNGAVGQFLYIDTSGYQSIHIQCPAVGGMSASITGSDDGVTFPVGGVLGYLVGSAASPVITISLGNAYVFPAVTKILRIQITTAGSAIAYLRNIAAPNPAVVMPQNISQVAGSNLVSAGLSGVISVAGPAANAVAPTANPNLVAGIDSGTPGTLLGVPLTRRILTDNTGRVRLADESPVSSFQQTPALNVQDTGLAEDMDKYQLLAAMLLEMRIANYLLHGLPQVMNTVFQNLQKPPSAQGAVFDLLDDEPAALRAEPSVFIQ
jgi:hypothetical protein